MSKESELIKRIAEGDDKLINETYGKHRKGFISWSIKYFKCSENDAKEAYQYAFFIFYTKIRSGEITNLSSSIKTYLFAIGKNKIFQENRHSAKIAFDINEELLSTGHDDSIDHHAKEQKFNSIENGLNQLGDPCRSMLLMFYYQKLDMTAIASRLGYKNTDTAKNLKYKCIQRLKKLVEEVKSRVDG